MLAPAICQQSCFLPQLHDPTRPAFEPPERLAIPVLRVDAQGSELVITASDTNYVMTYHEPANAPKLLAKTFPRKKDRRALALFVPDVAAKPQAPGSGGARIHSE